MPASRSDVPATDTIDPQAARARILARIEAAAQACGRRGADVTLTAVSKQQPWSRVAPVVAAGQTVFGENRVQEAMERWGERRAGLSLRLIGPLQTNKADDAVAFFDAIESLDRERLAQAIAKAAQKAGCCPELLVCQHRDFTSFAGVHQRRREHRHDTGTGTAIG